MSKKRTCLSLNEKVRIIEAAKLKAKKKNIAANFNCSISTVNRIIKNSKAIQSFYAANRNLNRKRLRKSTHETVEQALNLWFDEFRKTNITITGPMLLEKAKEFASRLDKDFHPDMSWVWRWRQREGHAIKKHKKKHIDIDSDADSDYEIKLSKFSAENVFSADETQFLYRAEINATKQENCQMTFLLLCNSTGSYRKLYAIGKANNPEQLPVPYYSNVKASMTSAIWNEILKSLDDELVAENRQIVLLVNNVECHKKHIDLKNITIKYLPINTGAIMQPLDLGIKHAFELHYKKIMKHRQLNALEITVLEALKFAQTAWNEVTTKRISNCFKRTGFLNGFEECETEDDEELLSHSDENLTLEPDEIVKASSSESEEDNISPPKNTPTSIKEALFALEVVQKFCHENALDYDSYFNNLENDILKLLVKKLGPNKMKQIFSTSID